MKFVKYLIAGAILLPAAVLAGLIAFGTKGRPPELSSISSPFKSVDFSDLPQVQSLPVVDGSPVAYRRYGPDDARDVVVAIHGSSASSSSLHPLAKTLAGAGMAVYAPDLRGHGATGRRGDIDYAGQLDGDLAALAAFVRAKHPSARLTLIGFSLGGGFALKTAGGPRGDQFDRYVLMAPALGRTSPTMRDGDDPWARPHIPRIVGLSILNRLGIRVLDGLEAIAFAVPQGSERIQTPTYSYRLLMGLLPGDHAAALRASKKPMTILVGDKDELFNVPQFGPAVHPYRPDVGVVIVPNCNHIGLSLQPNAHAAVLAALR